MRAFIFFLFLRTLSISVSFFWGGVILILTSLFRGVILFVTECDTWEGVGLKMVIFAWRHLWTLPYMFFLSFCNKILLDIHYVPTNQNCAIVYDISKLNLPFAMGTNFVLFENWFCIFVSTLHSTQDYKVGVVS